MTDEREPIIPWLLVPVAFAPGSEPRQIRLVKTFDSVPVKECPRIKEHDQYDAGPDHDGKIDIVPDLRCRTRVVELAEII